ncbi:MAG: sigma-70 family RNA polymerase sigma factor [Jiangellales bacterium]
MDREEEFRDLFAEQYALVVQAVFFILQDQGQAEEIAQDAFMQLLRHWGKVRDYEQPAAWVRRVALRLAVKSAQRERRINQALSRTRPEPSVDVSTQVAQHSAVFAAIGRLTPKERAVVVLFYFEDRPTAEIAQLLDCSENAAAIRLHRARQRMAELMQEVNVDVG